MRTSSPIGKIDDDDDVITYLSKHTVVIQCTVKLKIFKLHFRGRNHRFREKLGH